MNTEAVRVASLLTIARRYESAAKLYDRLIESAAKKIQPAEAASPASR